MSGPLRVLHLLDTEALAGTEKHVLVLLSELRGCGVDVSLACIAGSPLFAAAVASGVDTVSFSASDGIRGKLRIVCDAARAHGYTLLHAHNGRMMLIAALAHRLTGVGSVATQHFLEPAHCGYPFPKRCVARLAHRWVNAQLAHIIAVSSAARDAMVSREDLSASRITVIPNGIRQPNQVIRPSEDVQSELGVPVDGGCVACVARLEPEKDVHTLLRAMAEVISKAPEARCLVVGDGSEAVRLKHFASDLGVSANVVFTGYRQDVSSIVSAADVFVLPSLAEPFGLVLVEAMALGKPVIATRVGGPLEIVEDGVTGLLVPPADPAAMAEAIRALLADPERRRAMGEAGRARFEAQFTAERMARETVEVYRKVLEG